jgi:hypothetical protein
MKPRKFEPGDRVTIVATTPHPWHGKLCQLETRVAVSDVWKLYALDAPNMHVYFAERGFVHTAAPVVEKELTELVASLKDRVETLEQNVAKLQRELIAIKANMRQSLGSANP